MVEAPTHDLASAAAERLADVVASVCSAPAPRRGQYERHDRGHPGAITMNWFQ